MRFEEPKSNNRWDSVLFVVQKDDTLPFDTIADVLLKRKAPPPNASTLPVSRAPDKGRGGIISKRKISGTVL